MFYMNFKMFKITRFIILCLMSLKNLAAPKSNKLFIPVHTICDRIKTQIIINTNKMKVPVSDVGRDCWSNYIFTNGHSVAIY